jgi:hypothetical protein
MDPSPSALLGRVPVPALLLSSSHHSLSFSNTRESLTHSLTHSTIPYPLLLIHRVCGADLAEELPGDFVLQLEIGDM